MTTRTRTQRSRRPGRAGPHRTIAAVASAGAVVALLAGCAAPAAPTNTAELPAPAAPRAGNSAGSALTQTDVDAWLDGILPAALDREDIAGATVSVVSDGELLTARGYGYADIETERPVDAEDTLFRVGSISKLFTDTAVMQLVDSGDLDLDVDVAEYLDFTIPRTFDEPITLRTLMTHTAGFEERIAGLIRLDGAAAGLRDSLATDPPAQIYRPGTTPAYSNYSNGLAGYIVQRLSGEPFAQYIDEHILTPLGMSSSTFEQALPDGLASRVSRGYTTASASATPFEMVSPAPPGALTTSATDMAQFMLAQLGDLDGDHAVLTPDALALLQKPALDADTLGTLASGPRMTLGFFDESRNGHSILGHGGDTNVFHSHMQLYPDADTGIFVSFNSSGSSPTSTIDLRSAIMQGFTDRYFPADGSTQDAAARGTVDTETAQKHAALAAGVYASTRGFASTYLAALGILNQVSIVPNDDGTIVMNPAPMATGPATYREVEPWVWQKVGGQQLITMRAENGVVQTIGFESAFSATRVDAAHNAGLVLPLLVLSVLVLLLSLLVWPISALIRRHYRVAAPVSPTRLYARSRLLTRIGSAVTLVALVGWLAIVSMVVGFQDAPAGVVRGVQVLQAIGVLTVVPAGFGVALGIRHRVGWARITGSILVCASLVVIAWFAVVFKLIAPSISV